MTSEIQFSYSEDAQQIKIECPCGQAFTIPVPAAGTVAEAMCPKGCGHGLTVDRRIRFDRVRRPL
jgi:hypothetical protein